MHFRVTAIIAFSNRSSAKAHRPIGEVQDLREARDPGGRRRDCVGREIAAIREGTAAGCRPRRQAGCRPRRQAGCRPRRQAGCADGLGLGAGLAGLGLGWGWAPRALVPNPRSPGFRIPKPPKPGSPRTLISRASGFRNLKSPESGTPKSSRCQNERVLLVLK